MSFGAAKRLPCEGGSRSIASKGSSSLAWLLENEGELGETGGTFCWWVGLGGIVGGGGGRGMWIEDVVEGGYRFRSFARADKFLFVQTQFHCILELYCCLKFYDVQKVTYLLFFFQMMSEEQAQRLLHGEQALGKVAHEALSAASLSFLSSNYLYFQPPPASSPQCRHSTVISPPKMRPSPQVLLPRFHL